MQRLGDAPSRHRDTPGSVSFPMTRLSLLTFLALAFSGVALAAPPASQEIVAAGGFFTGGSWSYTDCGTWYFAVEGPTHGT